MKKTFKRTSAFVFAMAVMTAPMTFSSFVANAEGETVTSDYTLTIPATLAVANSGWNSIGNLTATGTLAQGKKLNVTATSENSWKLTSGENTVAYKLCGETEKTKTYADAAATTSLDISKESLEQTSGFSVPIGIVVEDYSNKPAGTYQDTVTFTAKVEDAAPATVLSSALVDGAIIKVNFKWRGRNSGDYVQGTYNADSGTFTVSKGGSDWGTEDRRAVYKVEKSGDNIIIGVGFYDYTFESMVWTFNTTNDTYTTTNGDAVNDDPGEYGLISVTLNGTDITSQLTKQ